MQSSITSSLIALALEEDMPQGDITTEALGCEKKQGKATLIAKSPLVLSGAEVFEAVFKKVDPQVQVQWHVQDGQRTQKGEKIASLQGSLGSILKAERVALNFLGHLSGIATLTSQFVEKTAGTDCKIIDTRKTTPGMRELEKKAVVHGGGVNHRMNLSDAVLIKENHIRTAGSITAAVNLCRNKNPGKTIIVEVTNEKEIREALDMKVDQILLDNMSLEEMKKAKKLIGTQAKIEASGNMTLERIADVARTGADFISVGAITHSAPQSDLSLLHE